MAWNSTVQPASTSGRPWQARERFGVGEQPDAQRRVARLDRPAAGKRQGKEFRVYRRVAAEQQLEQQLALEVAEGLRRRQAVDARFDRFGIRTGEELVLPVVLPVGDEDRQIVARRAGGRRRRSGSACLAEDPVGNAGVDMVALADTDIPQRSLPGVETMYRAQVDALATVAAIEVDFQGGFGNRTDVEKTEFQRAGSFLAQQHGQFMLHDVVRGQHVFAEQDDRQPGIGQRLLYLRVEVITDPDFFAVAPDVLPNVGNRPQRRQQFVAVALVLAAVTDEDRAAHRRALPEMLLRRFLPPRGRRIAGYVTGRACRVLLSSIRASTPWVRRAQTFRLDLPTSTSRADEAPLYVRLCSRHLLGIDSAPPQFSHANFSVNS